MKSSSDSSDARRGVELERKSSRTTVGLFLTQASLALINLPATFILARALGPVGLGTYQLLNRITLIAISVAQLGYPHALAWAAGAEVRAKNPSCSFRLGLGVAFLGGALIAAVAVFLLLSGLFVGPPFAWIILSVYPALNLAVANVVNCYRGMLKVRPLAMIRLSQVSIYLGSIIFATWVGWLDLSTAVLCLVIGQAGGFIVAIITPARAGFLRRTVRSKQEIREFRRHVGKFARKVFPGLMVRDWNVYLDQVIVGFFLGPEQLAFYAVAVSLSGALNLMGAPLTNTAQPIVQKARDGAEKVRVVAGLLLLSTIAVSTAGLILGLTASWVVPLLYGPAYDRSIPLVAVLSAAAVIDNLNSVFHGILLGLGRPTLSSKSIVVGLGVNIVGWVLLLPHLGILGAALTSLGAYLVVVIMMFVSTCRVLGVSRRFLIARMWTSRAIATTLMKSVVGRYGSASRRA